MRIRSITPGIVAKFKEDRLKIKTKSGKERSITTVNRELETLRAILRYAKGEGWIDRSPFENVSTPLISKADEGLRLALQEDFDLYILDNWLPDGSGVELCRAIREFDPETPILFYSAAAYKRDIREAMGAGAQAYLVKPVSFDELSPAVAHLTSIASES